MGVLDFPDPYSQPHRFPPQHAPALPTQIPVDSHYCPACGRGKCFQNRWGQGRDLGQWAPLSMEAQAQATPHLPVTHPKHYLPGMSQLILTCPPTRRLYNLLPACLPSFPADDLFLCFSKFLKQWKQGSVPSSTHWAGRGEFNYPGERQTCLPNLPLDGLNSPQYPPPTSFLV